MNKTRTATLIGATGLVGGHLLARLQTDPFFTDIRLLVRRPFAGTDRKTVNKLLDFTDAEAFRLAIDGSDVVFCAIGTTQKKVNGDRDAYRKIDFDIAVSAARHCRDTGCPTFVLVSSVGADTRSGNFYLRLKGEIEEAITALSLSSVSFFRPSMLLGQRGESRPAERAGQIAMKAFSFALPKRLKPVSAQDVAAAMLQAGKEPAPGVHVYEYGEITKLAADLTAS
ncbi:MAG: hypothetical protein JWP27_2489 [Flaviaesturariibacter sp.]|nr:hypothetical protein [Flaviaesturariibacter sp.]